MKILNIYGQEIFDSPTSATIAEAVRDAYLRGADLRDAYLRGADLRDANLRGANLSDAYLSGWAQVAFAAHGECGRMLTAYKQSEDSPLMFQCGCFHGTEEQLREFISRGSANLAASRLLALDTVKTLAEYKQ